MIRRRTAAFTLIELLVVITIIVVLLSLLTPALDKAIYQAELAVCATNLHALGMGGTTYAMDFKRRYPHRPLIIRNGWSPQMLQAPLFNPDNPDSRPMLTPYIRPNGPMLDPLLEAVDLESPGRDTHIWANYFMFFGVQYDWDEVGQGPMFKIGDRFSWGDARDHKGGANGHRFNILASDHDVVDSSDPTVYGSHPDKDGALQNVVYREATIDQINDGYGMVSSDETAGASLKQTFSQWQAFDTQRRGPVDLQFIYQDMGVRRVTDVIDENDERMVRIPYEVKDNAAWPDKYIHVPSN